MKNIFFIIIVLAICSCKSVQPVTFDKIESVNTTGISLQSIKLKVGTTINNPNDFKFAIKKMNIHIFINNIDFGKATIDDKAKIAANSNNVHYFNVETNPAKLLFQAAPLMTAINNHETINIKLQGKVKVKAYWLSKKFDVNLEEKIDVN